MALPEQQPIDPNAQANAQPIFVAWRELEAAFCDTTPGLRRWLDVEAGRLVTRHAHLSGDALALQRIFAQPRRYLRVDAIAAHEQHRWMTQFVATVADPRLRAGLADALIGTGSFRRFKQVLRDSREEYQRWLDARSEILRGHIEAWLRRRGVTVCEPRPGLMPDTTDEASDLQRVARAELERLPAQALPAALEFLRYLEGKER